MENVIHEIKIVETEDGFRIELKGDKERLRKLLDRFPFGMFGGMGAGMPFGFRGFEGGPRRGRHGRRGKRGFAWKEGGHHGHGRHERRARRWRGPKGMRFDVDFEPEEGPPHHEAGDFFVMTDFDEDDGPSRPVV